MHVALHVFMIPYSGFFLLRTPVYGSLDEHKWNHVVRRIDAYPGTDATMMDLEAWKGMSEWTCYQLSLPVSSTSLSPGFPTRFSFLAEKMFAGYCYDGHSYCCLTY